MKNDTRHVLCDRHTGEPLVLANLKTSGTPPGIPFPVRGTYLGVRHPIVLRSVDFRHADLRGTDVTGKDLSDADLTGAQLEGLKFDRFTRWPAGFDPLRLGAVLVPPDLGGQNCDGRCFDGEDLTAANFAGGSAVGASFVEANLAGANLLGLNLTGANLEGAVLTGAVWNHATRWPEGFTPPQEEHAAETIEALASQLKALGDPTRLRLLALVLREHQTGEELAATLGLTEATISHHLARLREAGLTQIRAEGTQRVHAALPDAVRALGDGLVERLTTLVGAEQPTDRFVQKVLEAFFENGRLKTIPARQKKQRIVLERLVAEFTPGVRYPESEVNAVLRAFHEDVATLRRLFIAERLMARENAIYWRI